MSLSYEYSIGSVRSKERSLLTSQDLEQLIAAKDEETALRLLKDKGYGDGSDIDEILEDSSEKMWAYLKSVAPDMKIFDVFIIRNDIHNLKTMLKSVMFDADCSNMLLSPCSIDEDELRDIVEQKKFDLLPQWMSKPAQDAYKLLAQTKDARLSDAVIDRAALEELQRKSKESGSRFLKEYFAEIVFYSNVKIALRAAHTKASVEYLERAISSTDGFDRQELVSKTLAGSEALIKYLEKINDFGCSEAIGCYKREPRELEKYADNRLMRMAKKHCRLTTEGAEPLLGYYTACEAERRAISIIFSGIRTHSSPDVIRERLRETYG